MEDVINQGSNQEEVTYPLTEANQETVNQTQDTTQKEDPFWIKNLRKERENYKRQSEEQKLVNEQLLKFVSSIQQSPAPVEQQEDIIQELQKEDYVPGEKVAKAFRKLQQDNDRKLQEIEAKFQQKHQADQWLKLKVRYPDLDEVVNPDTLNLVFKKDPELAMSWKNLDDYTLALQAYPYIKHSGILGDDPVDRRTREVEKKLEEPKKSTTTKIHSDRPMSQAFSYKEKQEAKNKLYAEMMGFASITGGGY